MAGGNNITVSITADVADLTAKMALAKVSVSDTTKEMMAQANAAGGQMTPGLMAASDAASKAAATQAILSRQLKAAAADISAQRGAAVAATSAMGGLQHGSAGVTREMLVMGRELARGNFSRMAGSATILAGRLGVLTPTVLMTAGAIALLAAPAIAFGLAAYKGSEQLTAMQNALKLTNGYAGVTIAQLQAMSKQLSQSTNVSIGEATTTMTKLAASGRFTSSELLLVGQNATIMGKLTGESADKFIDEFEKMGGDVAKFAADFAEHYHSLSAAQVDHIRLLENEGKSAEAQLELQKDLYGYLGTQAPEQLHGLEAAIHDVAMAFSQAWDRAMAFSRVVEGVGSSADKIRVINSQIEALKHQSGRGFDGSSIFAGQIADLEKQKTALVAQQQKDDATAAAKGKKDQIQAEGIAAAGKLSEKFEASKTSGEKLKKAIADINDELAKAKAANPANAALYEQEAAAARSQAEKSDTPHTAKGPKGPGQVAEWTEQLRAQEIASKNYYSDATADELKFWQSKVALTSAGSKERLEVEGKIYEASKALARQAYQDHIADLNEKIAAAKGDWAAQQALLKEKEAYIKGTATEQSRDYKNALREEETAQREHIETMLRQQEEAGSKMIAAARRQADEAKRASDEDAKIKITKIKDKSEGTPFGGVSAARQESEVKVAAIQAEIAATAKLQAAEDQQLQKEIDSAAAAGAAGKDAHDKLIEQKSAADALYAEKQKTLQDKMTEQQLAGLMAMKQAYTSYISGTVNTMVTGIDKMISGQMTLRNFGISVYQSIAREAITQIEKTATEWIVKHVLMAGALKLLGTTAAATAPAQIAATAATSKAQVALLAGVAGAGGVASMAAAPWPMDMTAPQFGAQMFAEAMAMGNFAKGTNIVPNDMIAQIHAGERIIPKADNDRLIQMTAAGAAGGGGSGGGGSGGGGTTHNHFSPTIHANGVDGKAVMAAIEGNFGDFTSLLKRAARNGVFR